MGCRLCVLEERHERRQGRLFAEHVGVTSRVKGVQGKGEENEGTHLQRSPSARLPRTILLTKSCSPPSVIISTSVPVQSYERGEQTALRESAFTAAGVQLPLH